MKTVDKIGEKIVDIVGKFDELSQLNFYHDAIENIQEKIELGDIDILPSFQLELNELAKEIRKQSIAFEQKELANQSDF